MSQKRYGVYQIIPMLHRTDVELGDLCDIYRLLFFWSEAVGRTEEEQRPNATRFSHLDWYKDRGKISFKETCQH